MGGKQIAQLLAEIPLFVQCSKRTLSTVARQAETVKVPAGSTLVEEGGTGDAFFVILSGAAEIRQKGAKPEPLTAGQCFGELSLVDPAPRSATVVAVTDVEVAVIGARKFRSLRREHPDLAEGLLTSLARQLRDASGQS